VPGGMVEEASGALPSTCGRSYTTRDCIGETSEATWEAMAEQEQAETRLIQMTMDHGPESSGRRTPLLSRMVPFPDRINQPMPRLDYPPYPRTYHPIERWWGLLELPWHGTKLIEAETLRGGAKQMTWKGRHPIVALSHQIDPKGIALGKAAMPAVAAR
jgi:hypothetical protein